MSIKDLLKDKWRQYKKRIGIKREIEKRGGEDLRVMSRRHRQARIRKEKRIIIQGLIHSWDLKEIKQPPRELYEKLNWYHHGLTIKYLRDLEKEYWT